MIAVDFQATFRDNEGTLCEGFRVEGRLVTRRREGAFQSQGGQRGTVCEAVGRHEFNAAAQDYGV